MHLKTKHLFTKKNTDCDVLVDSVKRSRNMDWTTSDNTLGLLANSARFVTWKGWSVNPFVDTNIVVGDWIVSEERSIYNVVEVGRGLV